MTKKGANGSFVFHFCKKKIDNILLQKKKKKLRLDRKQVFFVWPYIVFFLKNIITSHTDSLFKIILQVVIFCEVFR